MQRRRTTPYRRGAAATALVGLLIVIGFSGVHAVHLDNIVELDGNVDDGPDPSTDWAAIFDAGGNLVNPPPGLVSSIFTADFAVPDASYHAGDSDKDIHEVSTWQCGPKANPQSKTDILNAYAVLTPNAEGEAMLHFGFERATNHGNAFMGFWLFQMEVGCTPGPNGEIANFQGNHQLGDLLVLSDFTGGGTVSEIQVFRWNPDAPDNLEVVIGPGGSLGTAGDCTAAPNDDPVCGRVNADDIVTPWPPADTNANALESNQFFEAGLNLNALLGVGPSELPCFATFLAETRSSQQITADLKDFAGGTFETCDVRITIGDDGVNTVGDPHTFTVTVEASAGGAPFQPIDDVEVSAEVTEGDAVFTDSGTQTTTCTTGSSGPGQCEVTVLSTTAGANVVTASASVDFNGATFEISTDGSGSNSDPGNKVFEKAPSTTTTSPSSASIVLGDSVTDSVEVTGDVTDINGEPVVPTGTVAFFVCGPTPLGDAFEPCETGGDAVGDPVTLQDGEATSATFTPLVAGNYCFRGEYSGDDTYEPSSDASLGECFTVEKADVGLTTLSDPTGDVLGLGFDASDTATVSGLDDPFPAPTGSIEFIVCGPTTATPVTDGVGCEDETNVFDTQPLGADGTATSVPFSDTDVRGTYCWRAVYTGDDNYNGASHTDFSDECFRATFPDSSLDKAVRLLPDGDFVDSLSASPGDEIEYRLVYANTGNADATNVVLTEEVPEHATLTGTSAECSAPDVVPGTVITCELGTVGPDETREVFFQVILDATFPAGETVIPNVATFTNDEEGDGESDEVVVIVTAVPDLDLAKSADRTTVSPGGLITYTLVFWNEGDGDVEGAIITEPLPADTVFVSCTGPTGVEGDCAGAPGGPITWTVDVPAGTTAEDPAGSVTLTVQVVANGDCEICNVASISHPLQPDGSVDSNPVCITVGANAADANAIDQATGLDLFVDTALGVLVDETIVHANSSQSGPGIDADADELLTVAVDDPVGVTPFTNLATAKLVNATSVSVVNDASGEASHTSTVLIKGLSLLDGLVTADTVRVIATASATGSSAGVTSDATAFENLVVNGQPIVDVNPGESVDLSAVFGPDSGVFVYERMSATTTPAPGQLSGGTYAADITVNAVRVFLRDIDPITGGDQSAEVIVGQAIAHADFPQTPLCEAPADQAVSGHAFVASALTDPSVAPALSGFVSIPGSGGAEDQQIDATDLNGTTVDGATTSSQGENGETSSAAESFAEVVGVCLLPDPATGECLVEATTVRSDANASADANGASSAGKTTIVGLTIGGLDACAELGIEATCEPSPNTVVIDLPGIGYLILNEQIPDDDDPNDCSDGLTVRAMRLVVLGDSDGGVAEIIVAESHADARYC